MLRSFVKAMHSLRAAGLVAAYHDRSDGGLYVTLVEMAFAGHTGLEVDLGAVTDPIPVLFSEELGAVLQVLCHACPLRVLGKRGAEGGGGISQGEPVSAA